MGFKDLLRGSIASSVAKNFKDLFDRADQTGLGGAWTSIRGSFNISGNKAVGTTNDYPISVVTASSQDVDINLRGISEGAGAALWVTDSGNWFAIGIHQEPVDCNCVTQNVFVQGNTDYANQFVPGNYAWANQFVPGNFAWANQYVQGNTGNQNVYVAGNNYNVAVTNFDGYYTCNAYNATVCNANNTATCRTWGGGNCSAYNSTFCSYSYYSTANKKTVCGVYGGGTCKSYNATSCNAYNATNCKTWGGGTCKTSTADKYTFFYTASNAYTYSFYYDNSYTYQYQYNNEYTYQYQYNNQYTYQYSFNNSYTYAQTVCQTCYPQYIRVIQSIGSTVSTLTSWTIASLVKALRIRTTGNQITVTPFSDDSGVTQIGSDLVYTATGATVNPRYGIVVTPSTYSQGYSIDSINIDKN